MLDLLSIFAETPEVTPAMRMLGIALFILFILGPIIVFSILTYAFVKVKNMPKDNPKRRKLLIILSILTPIILALMLFFV